MPVTRSTEGTENTSKKSTRTAKTAAVPKAAASDSATAKAPAKTEPAASKPKKAAATAKPAPGAGTASNPTRAEITPEQKLQMIAEAAYFRAERRGFVGGNPTEDWVAAEAEVEARLSQQLAQQKKK